jgi:MoaA/NifB/PqqE/SkfB family radical SAM enzyme
MDRRVDQFKDPKFTSAGELRAHVDLSELRTLWFNTGTICNLACKTCFMHSTPTNDNLSFLGTHDVETYLREISEQKFPTLEIGFTGGEPFVNPELLAMLQLCLEKQYRVLVLTNAMKPMMKVAQELKTLRTQYEKNLVVRVSVDHYDKRIHEIERGPNTWDATLDGLSWLSAEQFECRVAGRRFLRESEDEARSGYDKLFKNYEIRIDAHDPEQLVLFPEMNFLERRQELTERRFKTLNLDPANIMCSHSRMVIKRKGAAAPVIVACTLIPDDPHFELGATLSGSSQKISLNHPFCAQFCVLGGATCSSG